jgi:hypothetical protein
MDEMTSRDEVVVRPMPTIELLEYPMKTTPDPLPNEKFTKYEVVQKWLEEYSSEDEDDDQIGYDSQSLDNLADEDDDSDVEQSEVEEREAGNVDDESMEESSDDTEKPYHQNNLDDLDSGYQADSEDAPIPELHKCSLETGLDGSQRGEGGQTSLQPVPNDISEDEPHQQGVPPVADNVSVSSSLKRPRQSDSDADSATQSRKRQSLATDKPSAN